MLVIVHFSPLELYPPIQNLIEVIDERNEPYKRIILSTNAINDDLTLVNSQNKNTRLIRLGKSNDKFKPIIRYWNYLLFYIGSLIVIIWNRPHCILYYETISCWPVYIYKFFFNRKCTVYIHYHEYTSPGEYKNGTFLMRIFNRLEKRLYPLSSWISHTNKYRLNLFQSDIMPIAPSNPQIIPNYPSRKWFSSTRRPIDYPVKVVYVGAISIDSMYTKQFVSWVLAQSGKVLFDLYSLYIDPPAIDYFLKLNSDFIRLKQAVDYKKLPSVLANYDVGIILYKGHIPNYVFNAPNKLFEYLALGLDVWFPIELIGTLEYARSNIKPKILSLDFNKMETFDLPLAISACTKMANDEFFCENAFTPLLNQIKRQYESLNE
ncbi:MAG: hypothetical protein ACKO96_14600 [Flammeovirgaceae bacterium]